VAAARGGHMDIVRGLVEGPAAALLMVGGRGQQRTPPALGGLRTAAVHRCSLGVCVVRLVQATAASKATPSGHSNPGTCGQTRASQTRVCYCRRCCCPQDGEDHVQDALKLVALAMEGGHWDLVEWVVVNHESLNIGSYFLPGIARHGRTEDMRRMLALMAQVDAGSDYLNAQVRWGGMQRRAARLLGCPLACLCTCTSVPGPCALPVCPPPCCLPLLLLQASIVAYKQLFLDANA
jgi:hypothetical protein